MITSTVVAAAAATEPPALAYWNANLPEAKHTAACPDFLKDLSAKDRTIMAGREDEYRALTWPEVQTIVAANELASFNRSPLSLRRYRAFLWQLRRRHGSVAAFVLRERLRWAGPPIKARGGPFECERDDVRVLQNDWPYGLDPRIVHLVVWTKFELAVDEAGEMLPETRAAIDGYVDRTFRFRIPLDNRRNSEINQADNVGSPHWSLQVIWFRNWSALKSVEAIEHFHVLLFDPDPAFVHDITGGIVPLYLDKSWQEALDQEGIKDMHT